MIARIAFVFITLGLSLGALYMLYEHRAPIPSSIIEPTSVTATQMIHPDTILYIDIQTDCIVHIIQEKGKPFIRLEADQALLPYLKLTVTNQTLILERLQPKNTLFTTPPPCYYIVIPDIASICARGTTQVFSQNTLTLDSLDLNARAQAHISLSLDTKQLDIEAHGQSVLCLTGTAHEQHIALYGSSRYDARQLISSECSIHASGDTNTHIHATSTLQGTISGSSNVQFFGNPNIFVTKNHQATLQQSTSFSENK